MTSLRPPSRYAAPTTSCSARPSRLFYEWLARSVETINGLNISQEEKDLILGGNAQRLFNI
jgi:hypothetical protein